MYNITYIKKEILYLCVGPLKKCFTQNPILAINSS
jgi:hypothetical protein